MEVLAYCLMDNHVHHLVVPTDKDGLARVFRPLHSEYALKTNFFHDWTGHLWQNRYFSCLVDDSYFNTVLSYIELNPVRAGMVALAEDYQWSSAKSRVYKLQNPVLSFDKHWVQRIAKISEDWSAWLRYGQREDEIKMIRKKTKQGLPCADPEVVKALEKKYGICLSHKPPGRRPK